MTGTMTSADHRSEHGTEELDRARRRLDRRFDQIAREYAGRPEHEVLGVLEREVCAAGVTPVRPDLTALAREISAAPASS
jgi:hypothetical protein